MKKLVLSMILVTAVFGCRKPQDTPALQSIFTEGTWRITLFRDNGNNLTFLFTAWRFTFNKDKTLLVTDGTDTYTGTWDENQAGDTFTLDINTPELELIYISQLWHNELLNPKQALLHNDRINVTKELQFTRL
jgi:hypothetical protein